MVKEKKQPQDWREIRRMRAWELKQADWQPSKIAEALGVTRGAVSHWFKKAEAEGVKALGKCRGGGPKAKLSEADLKRLPELLTQGAEVHGFRGEVWTRARVGELIKREFGISYTPEHVGYLLKKIGWSRQKPVQRASQRNEAAIEQWRTETWKELKKKPNVKNEP
jgi:transposase